MVALRRLCFGALIAAALAIGPSHDAVAGPSPSAGLVVPRLVTQFRTVLDALLLKLPGETDHRRLHAFNFAAEVLRAESPSVENDVQAAGNVCRALGKTLLAETPFDVLIPKLLDDVHGLAVDTIDDFGLKVDRFAANNPKVNVTKQRNAIAAARGLAADSLLQMDGVKRMSALSKALAKLKSVQKFDFVAKPPKSCRVKPLSKGEFARGPGTFLEYEPSRLEAGYFQGNWGNCAANGPQGAGGTFTVNFGYCTGESTDETLMNFTVPQTVGTHPAQPNQAGFRRGKGFVSNVTSNSSITIDAIDYDAGYITGTYSFDALLGYGNGTVQFLLYIDKAP